MDKKTLFLQPAFPTFPVQDQLGQLQMGLGMNKLEHASTLIAAQIMATADANMLPETIAQEAVKQAMFVLEECENRAQKLDKSKTIHL